MSDVIRLGPKAQAWVLDIIRHLLAQAGDNWIARISATYDVGIADDADTRKRWEGGLRQLESIFIPHGGRVLLSMTIDTVMPVDVETESFVIALLAACFISAGSLYRGQDPTVQHGNQQRSWTLRNADMKRAMAVLETAMLLYPNEQPAGG